VNRPRWPVRIAGLALVLAVSACAGLPAGPAEDAIAAGAGDAASPAIGAAGAVSAASARMAAEQEGTVRRRKPPVDPFEPVNRAIWRFNDTLDGWVLRPVAVAYDRYTPDVVRMIVRNVLSNLLDPYIGLNNFLQGKPAAGFSDFGRFALNSTFGFFGFGDPASDVGLEKHREDFGQTLGRWGVPGGPYLMLPLFGPSDVRDGIGFGVDAWAALISRFDSVSFRNTLAATEFIETRARLLPAERVLDDALDRYLLVRDSYLQRRRNLIWDGEPPDEDDDED
jgi:phospholipid-binding lipoprotein MlaA